LATFGFAALGLAQETQTLTGKVMLSIQKLNVQAGETYEITLEGKKFGPLLSHRFQDFSQLSMIFAGSDITKPNVSRVLLVAKRTGELPVNVTLPSGVPDGEPESLDYTMKVKRIAFSKQALLEKQDALVASDPVYKEGGGGSPHKAYPITLKSGKFYKIDMVRKQGVGFGGMDPYLYLEDTKATQAYQKIVARDDDSGGNLNARIVYQPKKDGEFRVIATSLNRMPGEFTITVREQE
jgi:hypothetical protein